MSSGAAVWQYIDQRVRQIASRPGGKRCLAALRFEGCLAEPARPGETLPSLRWKRGALALLKALAFDSDLQAVIISALPEAVVGRKLRRSGLRLDVVGSSAPCPQAEMIGPPLVLSDLDCGRCVRLLSSSSGFDCVFVISASAEDAPMFREGIGIMIGGGAAFARFTVQNLGEARAVLWSVSRTVRQRPAAPPLSSDRKNGSAAE